MWSVILCKCSGMETLNCFVHIYQFYISSWKLNLLLPESSKIQAVALSAQGEHKPGSLSSISCLHVGSISVSFHYDMIWRKIVPDWWLYCLKKALTGAFQAGEGPNRKRTSPLSVNVESSRRFLASSGCEVAVSSLLSTRYLLERVMWKLIKVFAPWLLAAGGLVWVWRPITRGVIYNYNCTNTSGLSCCIPTYFFYTSEGALCYMIIIYKFLMYGEEQRCWLTVTVSPCSPAGGVRAPAAGVGGHGHRGGRGGGRVLVWQVGGAVDIAVDIYYLLM